MSLEETDESFSDDEKRRLTENLYGLTYEVERGDFSSRFPDLTMLCDLHRRLFGGVRDHAGRHRSRTFGSEHLTYGPHRSSHRNVVEDEMQKLFDEVRGSLRSFEGNADQPDYERLAIRLAAFAHARVVRTHPFEDGNGRSSRLLMGIILVRLDLPNIPIEACRDEYLATLNHYYTTTDIDPLVDLLLEIAVSNLS